MASKFFNDNEQSKVISLRWIDKKKSWIVLNIYRGGFDHDELDLSKEEARQLRDALNELLNE